LEFVQQNIRNICFVVVRSESVASLDFREIYLPSLASSRVTLVGMGIADVTPGMDGSDEQLEEDGEKRGKGASRWLHASWALLPGAEASSGGGR
jgi:hypothetical protein